MKLLLIRTSLSVVMLIVGIWLFDSVKLASAQESHNDSMMWLTITSLETPIGVQTSESQEESVVSSPPVIAVPELNQISFQLPLLSQQRLTIAFSEGHPGVDLAIRQGTEVIAAESGLVTEAGWSKLGYGNTIVLHHTNNIYTRYAHLSGMNVSVGQYITKGMQIGLVGCTGRCTGAHLHFEIRENNRFIDPLSVVHF